MMERDAKRPDTTWHVLAIGLALVLHVGLGVGITLAAKHQDVPASTEDNRFANARIIEASLVKKGKPKDEKKQPTRETIAPVAPPEGTKVTRSEEAAAKSVGKPSPPPVDPRAKIDPLAAAQERARKMAGADAVPQGDAPPSEDTGDANGSEWGRAAVAAGDPYLAEVVGRIQANWEVPETMISAEELLTLKLVACFKVNAEGDIVDTRIDKPSRSKRFDRTFEDAITKTKNVTEPRGEFKKTIQEEGICLRFDKKE